MALYFSEDGLPFLASPYTDEENQKFEERLRRGGDITIITQRKCCDRDDSADHPNSVICPLLIGPSSILGMVAKEEWTG